MSNKNSFILYLDHLIVLDELSDEQAGKLFKVIRAYHSGDNETYKKLMNDTLIRIVFSLFKSQFIRDIEKYNKVVERNRENGKKGGAT
jgi:hypothetical protein